jgi:rod shape-determining protein MreC
VEHLIERKRNKMFLSALLLGQLMLLGYQVRRPDAGGVRLVRLWSIEAILPAERVSDRIVNETRTLFHGYVGLREVNRQNQQLQAQVAALRLENQHLVEGVRELPALETLLGFQRAYGIKTVAAPVISSGITADAQTLYLDGGSNAGFARNMPVVNPSGLVGKLTQVLGSSSQVMLITDSQSGAGVLIGDQRIHGIATGLGAGRIEIRDVLKDEPVAIGAAVVTSGDDQVFPKGIPVGTVTGMRASTDGIFRVVELRPAVDLGRLEQVLVVTGALPPPDQQAVDGATAAAIRQALLPSLPAFSAPTPGAFPQPAPPAGATPLPPNTPPAEGDALGGAAPKPKPPVIVHPHG